MVKITKVYTKSGDDGWTSLAGQQRRRKDDVRIYALGEVDELNALVGLVVSQMDPELSIGVPLSLIQQQLFNLGAQLAVLPVDRRHDTPVITTGNIETLEQSIDQLNELLPTLTSFVLPGGHPVAAQLHHARTVCRRAERTLVVLQSAEPDNAEPVMMHYLNRLSDWLFVAARWVNQHYQHDEVLWHWSGR
jgi:cob(I)alamin adenosyltransferase